MGSSKKHKDKDREHKRKRRHRSRSRSRERRSHKEGRDRGERSKRKRRRSRSREYSDVEKENSVERILIKQEDTDDSKVIPAPVPSSTGGGGDVSLSIGETNKLRAKLGLKPLDLPKAEGNVEAGAVKEEDEDVHVPAINLGDAKRTEELRLKMAQIREKRLHNKKLGKVKTLGDSDSEEEDTVAWVRKNRKIQKEREQAEKRAKMLEEMDQDFGISNLVDEEFGANKPKEYGSKDLRGLKVQHAQDSFKEGQTVILTLQDKGILDEDGDDTLVNVNIIDSEKAAKNIENKKIRPDYKPYDEPEYDEYGMFKQKEILDKYDEEIDGAKKESFQLGSGGKYDAEHERRMQQMKLSIKDQAQTLTLAPPSIASEFYTEDEMASFNKVKKKVRKIRKKAKAVKAEDLVPLDLQPVADHGSRIRGSRSREIEESLDQEDQFLYGETVEKPTLETEPGELEPDPEPPEDMELDDDLEEAEILGPEEDLSGVAVVDEAVNELELALNKARKLKRRLEPNAPEKVAEKLLQQQQEKGSSLGADADGANIVLNSTSEFCRALGDIPTYGQAGNREEDQEDLMEFEQELEDRKRFGEDGDPITGWTSVVDLETAPVDIKAEDANVLDEETVVDAGIASALEMAVKKGFLVQEEEKKGLTLRSKIIQAQNYSIEDKRYDDLDEKYKKRDRYGGGITMDFKEKSHYKPEVHLEYVDDGGRMLSQKEAFRQLSHRFHGKGSGKKKTEKRSKRIEDDLLMKQMSSTDTPLNTVSLFREKQRAEKTPYIILSGGNKGMTAASISKPN